MKTIGKTILALLFVGSLSITAQAKDIAPEKTLAKEIASMLSNIQLPSGDDIVAEVKFLVNADNEIVIVSVDADESFVETIIKGKLNYQKVKSDEATPNKVNTVKIRLKQPY